jgi:hypothetical protein
VSFVLTFCAQEARIDNLVPQAISPKSIEHDLSDIQQLSRRIKRVKITPTRRHRGRVSCSCHGQSETVTLLQWPFLLSKTRTKVHSTDCPYSAVEDAVTDLNMRVSICIIALKRKAQVTIALSKGAGASSLTPTLRTYGVVKENSPAFRLLGSFRRRVTTDPGPEAWQKAAQDLYKLFQRRLASPHDRLPNGQTMLHVCYPNRN